MKADITPLQLALDIRSYIQNEGSDDYDIALIIEEYTTAKIRLHLERAAEQANASVDNAGWVTINKDSITSLSIILE